jgi:hypothetical protein
MRQDLDEIDYCDFDKPTGETLYKCEMVQSVSPGVHYIKVVDGAWDSWTTDWYTLTVTVEPVTENREIEPNNDAAGAIPLTSGVSIQGTLFYIRDQDWYTINVTQPGQQVRVSITSTSNWYDNPNNAQTWLMRQDLDEIDYCDFDKPTGETLYKCEMVQSVSPGVHYIKVVDGAWDSWTTDWYTLMVTVQPATENREIEPNDTSATASVLQEGANKGKLFFNNDTDWFKINVNGYGVLTLTVEAEDPFYNAETAHLYSADGVTEITSGPLQKPVAETKYSVRFDETVNTGTYYLKFSGGGWTRSWYTISMHLEVIPASWPILGPAGTVVQFPLFRLRYDPGYPTTEHLQYRVEVSTDDRFLPWNTVIFDQRSDSNGWTMPDYGPDEMALLLPVYDFEHNKTYYWRARAYSIGGVAISEYSPVLPLHIIEGAVVNYFPVTRVGRTDRHDITLINPSAENSDFALKIVVTPNDPRITGSFRVLDRNGNIAAQGMYGESVYLTTPPLPPGQDHYTLETQTTSTPRDLTLALVAVAVLPINAHLGAGLLVGWTVDAAIDEVCRASVVWALKNRLSISDEEAQTMYAELREKAPDYWVESTVLGLVSDALITIANAHGIPIPPLTGSAASALAFSLQECACTGIASEPTLYQAFSGAICRPGIADLFEEILRVVFAWDPNMKAGAAGTEGFITGTETLPYTVFYENLPAATAAAQEVTITDQLDPGLDLGTFQFTGVGFSGNNTNLAEGTKAISEDVDLRPTKNIVVQIRGQVDTTTRQLTVTFRGVDPDTGELHPDGFLPPNANPPEGDGFVSFSVLPKENLPSGTEIRNKASIIFDVNPPMDTNEVMVTIDTAPPSSQATPLPATQTTTTFPVRWQATDDASGVDRVEVWFSERQITPAMEPSAIIRDGEIWNLAGTAATDQSEVQFTSGRAGYEYRFYTVAIDRVGNRELEPAQPDRVTQIVPPPTPGRLTVTKGPASPSDSTVPKGSTNVPVLQLSLQTDATEAIRVDNIRLKASGTGNDASSIIAVKVWRDANGDGVVNDGQNPIGSGTYPSDDGFALINLNYTIPSGESERWLITYDFAQVIASTQPMSPSMFALSQSKKKLRSPNRSERNDPGAFLHILAAFALLATLGIRRFRSIGLTLLAVAGVVWLSACGGGGGGPGTSDQEFSLTVNKAGNGNGVVTSGESPPKINCGFQCSSTFSKDTTVSLSAQPALGSQFIGWSGDCAGNASPFLIKLERNKACTATFNLTPPVEASFTLSVQSPSDITSMGVSSNQPTTSSGSFPIRGAILTVQR